jgi:hypothetical protein
MDRRNKVSRCIAAFEEQQVALKEEMSDGPMVIVER